MKNIYAIGAATPVFTPTVVPPTEIPKIDWNTIAAALLNAGLTAYQVERQIQLEKAKAAAAAAAGQSYTLNPGAATATDYMPYVLGGVGLLVLVLLMKRK